ncbi:hypothetical protein CLV47_12114 [Antricoccus suffuscus]|uniref:Uncharacterized protein n=1 Tax=Antricoccus suffuscus TaxID=1629062 RepID=A0A2T0ZKB3_9ACTN|nr:hypothetical protein [Antricoccus suffuscus]PRZ36578.1 hypothetical protein CLV47_12114 [Antricoccus suffuscus]
MFSSAGANRLARSLWGALRDRALDLPDDAELRDEFIATRLVETAPGVVKIQNPAGSHDDIVTAVAMVVADLANMPDVGRGSIAVPHGRVRRQYGSLSTRDRLRQGAVGPLADRAWPRRGFA